MVFDSITSPIKDNNKILPFEWRRWLSIPGHISPCKIWYHGDLFPHKAEYIIIPSDETNRLYIEAECSETGQRKILFDSEQFGLSALVNPKPKTPAPPLKLYKDNSYDSAFKIQLSAFYQEEFEEIVDSLELDEQTYRNAFDHFSIFLVRPGKRSIELIARDLSV